MDEKNGYFNRELKYIFKEFSRYFRIMIYNI